jgi:hypothetical protein
MPVVSVVHEIDRTCGVFLLYNRCPRISEALAEVWSPVDDMMTEAFERDDVHVSVTRRIAKLGEDNG